MRTRVTLTGTQRERNRPELLRWNPQEWMDIFRDQMLSGIIRNLRRSREW